jgi:hypothetical protein
MVRAGTRVAAKQVAPMPTRRTFIVVKVKHAMRAVVVVFFVIVVNLLLV